ncbi:acyltransferase family protein [Sphingosinicella sp. CPCC 101087]|uniref:acyltransferase family protein n=1 Tax=Sphingosinicella sp. CPCC 101087 TaxID=2497754 RepID=UPI00101BFDCF|nr:acyltransferase family protein [Sphingosinicella sp. CPCC 101087]
MTVQPPVPARLFYLDWLRVAAFGLLILYHVGMFYVTWDWHVKSDRAGPAIEPLMMLTNPWRLTLLFFVSGAATRFMADRMAPARFAGQRTVRLLVPLLFAMFVIVPPQSYYEVVEKLAYSGSYLDFMARYLAADGSFCRESDCLILPTWNHLWFVAYLLAYSLVLAAGLALLPNASRGVGAWLGRAPAWALLAGPIVYLGLARLVLLPRFEVTHALVDDWYNHAVSFAAFLLGFLIMKEARVTAAFVRLRWPALILFGCAYAGFMAYAGAFPFEGPPPPDWLWGTMRFVYAVEQWGAIVAALGFGALHLNRDSRLLRTLTVAVFPFYIAHQTIIVVAGHHLNALRLPLLAEAALLIGATALGCWLTFEIARRADLLRPLLGLGPRRPAGPPLDPARAAR